MPSFKLTPYKRNTFTLDHLWYLHDGILRRYGALCDTGPVLHRHAQPRRL